MAELIPVALSLGGNLGDVARTFANAAAALQTAGMRDVVMSSLYSNPAVGCAPGTPDFINAVLIGQWTDSVTALHAECKRLEVASGRPLDHEYYGSRTLDLDIVLFGKAMIVTPELHIPHREALKRLFVLVPLAEVAADWYFPGQERTVSELLAGHCDTPEYRQFISGKI